MKTVVNTKLLLAAILVVVLMVISCNCVSEEYEKKVEKSTKEFYALKPGDVFLETTWNKPGEGLTLSLYKKTSGATIYKLAIDDNNTMVTDPIYLITLDTSNNIISIELEPTH